MCRYLVTAVQRYDFTPDWQRVSMRFVCFFPENETSCCQPIERICVMQQASVRTNTIHFPTSWLFCAITECILKINNLRQNHRWFRVAQAKKYLPFLYKTQYHKTQYHTLGEGNSRYCQTASLSLRESWKCCHGIEVVWTFMKFKICLYFWVVFGPWRRSVASYTTDERAKNGQKERWRWNLEELMLLTKSSSEKFRRLHFINPFLRVSNLLPKLLTFDTL